MIRPAVEFPLSSPQACVGEQGSYIAATYFLQNGKTEWNQIELGHYSPDIESPISVIRETSIRLGAKLRLGHNLPLQDLAAVCVMRVCGNRRHELRSPDTTNPNIERVASYAIARSIHDIEELHPLSGYERMYGPHGFGHARRTDQSMFDIGTLIHLPTTPAEDKSHLVLAAVKAYPRITAKSDQPYVALHAMPNGSHIIEQILTADHLL